MNHHAWMYKHLMVLAGTALAVVAVCRAGGTPSRLQTNGNKSSAPQETNLPPPRPSTNASEQTSTKLPRVTYKDGQLTIIAVNSSLSEVMTELRKVLGTDIDLPPSAAGERIWVHLGPGPARRVLRDLLDGMEFNYVIQASETDENGVQSVLLTPRGKDASAAANHEMPEMASSRKTPGGSSGDAVASGSDNPTASESSSVARDSVPGDASAPSMNAQPASVNAQAVAGNSNTGTPGTGPRSTEQMIQQLQSMYQQRRQIQHNQNQKPPSPN